MNSKYDQGRTKNVISTVVGGIVGQKLYGNSTVDLEIQKKFFHDAKVTGTTTEKSIDTNVDLTLTSSNFKARTGIDGMLKGKVDKSEIDWKIRQTGPNTYEVARWGPKFDSTLKLSVEGGKIVGEYVRPGPNIDWNIEGSYDNQGNVEIEIDGPLTLGINLEGKISKR